MFTHPYTCPACGAEMELIGCPFDDHMVGQCEKCKCKVSILKDDYERIDSFKVELSEKSILKVKYVDGNDMSFELSEPDEYESSLNVKEFFNSWKIAKNNEDRRKIFDMRYFMLLIGEKKGDILQLAGKQAESEISSGEIQDTRLFYEIGKFDDKDYFWTLILVFDKNDILEGAFLDD